MLFADSCKFKRGFSETLNMQEDKAAKKFPTKIVRGITPLRRLAVTPSKLGIFEANAVILHYSASTIQGAI